MIHRTIKAPGLIILLLLLPCLSMAQSTVPTITATADETLPTPEILTAQVAEISRSSDIPFDKKEGRIAATVRLATAAVLAQETDPKRQLELATQLATAASADPRFTPVIANAILSAPALATIDGAAEKIRASAYAAAEQTRKNVASTSNQPGVETIAGSTLNQPKQDKRWKINPFANNSAFHLGIDTSITHDDNVYLTEEDNVSDQIMSISPGLNFAFGQNSLLHGSANYQVEFLKYAKDTAPSTHLTHSNVALGYNDERLTLSASAAYNENYQNTRQTITAGSRAIFETDTLNLGGNGEVSLSPLTSLSSGASYSLTTYDFPGLFDRTSYSIPFNVYYKATPKLDLSLGASYRSEKSKGHGTGAEDWFYNLGLRGNFTAKLSGSLSAGYRTRQGENGLDDSMLGFTAGLNLELTVKSALSFNASRDFNVSAQGQSLENSSYSLSLSSSFTPQWSASTHVSYQQIDYGSQIYGSVAGAQSTSRKDDYWEGGFSTSYLFTSWLSSAASYTLRSNSSSINGANFSNNLLSLTVSLKF